MSAAGYAIERLDGPGAAAAVAEIARIHIACVAGNAGVSFMHPLDPAKAEGFWRGVAGRVAAGEIALLVARRGGQILGTVQAVLAVPENQPHRADVAKLLVDPAARRQGIARALMQALEAEAAKEGRTLLVLDTVTGGLAEQLYQSLGWIEVGVIPGYAYNGHGDLAATTYMYKQI